MPRWIVPLPSIVIRPRLGAQNERSPGAPSGTVNGLPGGGGGCCRRQIGAALAAEAGRTSRTAAVASVAFARLITVRARLELLCLRLPLLFGMAEVEEA